MCLCNPDGLERLSAPARAYGVSVESESGGLQRRDDFGYYDCHGHRPKKQRLSRIFARARRRLDTINTLKKYDPSRSRGSGSRHPFHLL